VIVYLARLTSASPISRAASSSTGHSSSDSCSSSSSSPRTFLGRGGGALRTCDERSRTLGDCGATFSSSPRAVVMPSSSRSSTPLSATSATSAMPGSRGGSKPKKPERIAGEASAQSALNVTLTPMKTESALTVPSWANVKTSLVSDLVKM